MSDNIKNATYNATGNATRIATGNATLNATKHNTLNAIWGAINEELKNENLISI